MSYQKEISKKKEMCANEKVNIRDVVFVDIYNAVKEIRYGSVQIHIQDGKIVQIDKINKVRMR